jgi:hypothetical protein
LLAGSSAHSSCGSSVHACAPSPWMGMSGRSGNSRRWQRRLRCPCLPCSLRVGLPVLQNAPWRCAPVARRCCGDVAPCGQVSGPWPTVQWLCALGVAGRCVRGVLSGAGRLGGRC